MKRSAFYLVAIASAVLAVPGYAREWTDATGRYRVEADLVAFNGDTVVLRRGDGELGALSVDQLSAEDQQYLASQEAGETVRKVGNELQTWTTRGGLEIVGRVVGYARKDVTLRHRRGRLYVDDRAIGNLPEMYQQLLPRMVATLAKAQFTTIQGLEDWLTQQKGAVRTLTLEGVIFAFENGDEYVLPFFLFADKERRLLESGWDEWVEAQREDSNEKQRTQGFLLRALAAARQQNAQLQRQIARLQLDMDVRSGRTSIWEVTLYPARGTAGRPVWVTVPGVNSMQAVSNALSRYPGYTVGSVRSVYDHDF